MNVVDEVRKLTGGYGCDVYIEATGHPESVNQGLQGPGQVAENLP